MKNLRRVSPSIGLLWITLSLPVAAQRDAPEVQAPWIGYTTAFYPAGLGTSGGVLVDLDGDGLLDAATISGSVSSQLSVLLGDGLGGFEPAVLSMLAKGGVALAAADMDGDTDLDLVVADAGSGSGTVSVYLNDGAAGFDVGSSWAIGGFPRAVAVADIDGDGAPDVVAALQQSVGLLLGNGDGSFQPASAFVLSSGVEDVALGDLEGDGDVDVVVGHSAAKISVLENIGIGFGQPVSYPGVPAGSFNASVNVHLADVDLDGDLDALLSGSGTGLGLGGPGVGAIGLFRNPGSGTFGSVEVLPMDAVGGGAVDLAVADLTGDGWPDLAAATQSSYMELLPGDGGGGFLAARRHGTGGGPTAVGVGDLNGDGAPEVAVVAGSSMDVCVHLNQGAGTFFDPGFEDMLEASLAPASSSRILAGDLDGDGDLDAVVGYSENFNGRYGISVRRNQGDGSLAPAERYETPQFPEWMTLGDLDGDGFEDLIWLDGWGAFNARLRWKPNLGDGRFGATLVLPGSYCEQDAELMLLDLTGDGLPEILVFTCYDRLFALPNAGGGVFQAPEVTTLPGGSGALAGADFNGDGFGDIATNSGVQGYVNVNFGLGDGRFGAPVTWVTGRGVEALAVGDLNADGQPDLVAAYQLDGDGVSVLLGRADGTFESAVNYPGIHSGSTDDVTLGDLDGDGNLDVLVANHAAREVSFWAGRGDGSLATARRFGTGHSPTSLVAGDFTGDGRSDVLALVEPPGAGNWYYPAVTLLSGLADPWTDLGQGLAGSRGMPVLTGAGAGSAGTRFLVQLEGALEDAQVLLVGGRTQINQPLRGAVLVPDPEVVLTSWTDPAGTSTRAFQWPSLATSGLELYFQAWIRDPGAGQGFAVTNGLRAQQP